MWCSAAGDSAIPNNDNRQGPADKTSSSLDSALAGLDKMLGVEEEKPVEMMPEEEENPTITVPLLWRGGGGGSSVAASLDPTSVAAAEYCGLTLKFPQRATPSQKERGLAGVELDFVLVRAKPYTLKPPLFGGLVNPTEADRMPYSVAWNGGALQDTACSTDFVLPQVAQGLDVEVVGETPGGVAATGER